MEARLCTTSEAEWSPGARTQVHAPGTAVQRVETVPSRDPWGLEDASSAWRGRYVEKGRRGPQRGVTLRQDCTAVQSKEAVGWPHGGAPQPVSTGLSAVSRSATQPPFPHSYCVAPPAGTTVQHPTHRQDGVTLPTWWCGVLGESQPSAWGPTEPIQRKDLSGASTQWRHCPHCPPGSQQQVLGHHGRGGCPGTHPAPSRIASRVEQGLPSPTGIGRTSHLPSEPSGQGHSGLRTPQGSL